MFRQQELQQETGQHTLRGARWETLLQGWNKEKVFEKSRIRKKTIVWCCKKMQGWNEEKVFKRIWKKKKTIVWCCKKIKGWNKEKVLKKSRKRRLEYYLKEKGSKKILRTKLTTK